MAGIISSGTESLRLFKEFRNLTKENRSILVHEGQFSQEVIKSILNLANEKLELQVLGAAQKKKVLSVMLECLQNISKHCPMSLLNEMNELPIIAVASKGNHICVSTRNPVSKDSMLGIKERIDKLNKLDRDGLDVLYKDVMKNGKISNVGGGGLGFIEMALKSSSKLHYSFEQNINEIYFYSLYITIAAKKTNNGGSSI
tara:strand:+ start:826 stop:1425 length:600 start_codon:yes stop_codon:yes gene_type:complete